MKQIIFFGLFMASYMMATAQPKQEMRAAWVATAFSLDWPRKITSGAEVQQKELTAILDKLKEAHFNTIFFQVRMRGDVIYNSHYEPMGRNVAVSSHYDPLAFAVEECHKRGLELHAWFTPYNLGSNSQSPTVNKHSDIVKCGKTNNSKGEYFFDPGEPQTNRYLLSLIAELVSNYDIDGFHLDRIRYPDPAEDIDDHQTFRKYGNGLSTNAWRRKNINAFVYEVYDAIKSMKPWVQVSSAVIGIYSNLPSVKRSYLKAYDDACQDPADWLRKGKQDFIVPMMYYTNDLFFPSLNEWLDYSYGRFVVPGLGLYKLDEKEGNWSTEQITKQIQYSRNNHAQGNAFFRTLFLTENKKGILDELTRNYYTDPALLYPLKWLKDTPPVPPFDPKVVRRGDNLQLQWDGRQPDSKDRVYYNVYSSSSSPVDISNPKNLIATRLESNSMAIQKFTGKYYVITTYDRYHNESHGSEEIRI